LLGPSAVGIDLSSRSIEVCRARGLQVVQHDLSQGLPFENAAFASVLCSHVLEHMENPLALLREIARVTSVDGRVAVGVPIEHSVARALRRAPYYAGHPGHLYAFSPDGLRRLAEVAGLQDGRILYDPPMARRLGKPQWTEGSNRLPEWLRAAMTFNLWLLAVRGPGP
jgi:SAM-dependent methyltransferase